MSPIVCVDDQAEVRRLLGDVFRAQGRDVVSFDDGEDAIGWLRAQIQNRLSTSGAQWSSPTAASTAESWWGNEDEY